MISAQQKNEGWLYGLAFLIAAGLRFVQLGTAPLTDSEATLALQALHLAQGQSVVLLPQPGYILFASWLFLVTESTNFLARLLPALAGSLLVFAPYFFRSKLGARPAVILAFLLAIDPGLTALSRQTGGTMLAVTALLFAWGLWRNGRETGAGICLGLALLAGPSIWGGLLGLGLTWMFLRGLQPSGSEVVRAEGSATSEAANPASELPVLAEAESRPWLRPFLIALVSTLILAGTLFLTVPGGLSAALGALPAYLNGWITPPGSTVARTLFTFLTYEVLGIALAALALFRGFRTNSRRAVQLSLWLGVALLLGVFYRQPAELAWAVIPLLALAARELARALDLYREELVEVGVVVFSMFILMVYIWFNIAGLALNPVPIPATIPIFGTVDNPRAFVLFGSLFILVVSLGLVAFGWSMRTARLGATWAITFFLGLYSLGAAWGASGLRNPGGVELWLPDATRPLQAGLLRASVDELSEFSLGHIEAQPITIYGISSPALEWLLRGNELTVVTSLDPQLAPPVVITPVMNDVGLPAAYRGQDFTWRQTPQWDFAQNTDWVTWLVFRRLPLENESILLWARADLFPDARGRQP